MSYTAELTLSHSHSPPLHTQLPPHFPCHMQMTCTKCFVAQHSGVFITRELANNSQSTFAGWGKNFPNKFAYPAGCVAHTQHTRMRQTQPVQRGKTTGLQAKKGTRGSLTGDTSAPCAQPRVEATLREETWAAC